MTISIETSNVLGNKLNQLQALDFAALTQKWAEVLREDNERGILAGTDGNDVPLVPGKRRRGPPTTAKRTKGQGIGLPRATGTAPNGPPLAPRGKQSRVIANYAVKVGQNGTTWYAEGSWNNVVNNRGEPFLQYHFNGMGHNPKRDLRGVRAWGRAEASKALKSELERMLRTK